MNERYDTEAAAEKLGVASQTLCNWRHKRKGPAYYKIGDRVYYSREDIDRFIKSGRVDPNE